MKARSILLVIVAIISLSSCSGEVGYPSVVYPTHSIPSYYLSFDYSDPYTIILTWNSLPSDLNLVLYVNDERLEVGIGSSGSYSYKIQGSETGCRFKIDGFDTDGNISFTIATRWIDISGGGLE